MAKAQTEITFTDEDGFEIHRGNDCFVVYAEASATYERTYTPGTQWDPPWDERERVSDVTVEILRVYTEEGNEVDIELTDGEKKLVEDHLTSKLDDEADGDDSWDFDTTDYGDE